MRGTRMWLVIKLGMRKLETRNAEMRKWRNEGAGARSKVALLTKPARGKALARFNSEALLDEGVTLRVGDVQIW